MTIEPCRTCFQADGCGIRLEKIRSVRGLKLTKIQFRCSILKESLKPGMKAQADLQYVATGYTYEEHELKTEKKTAAPLTPFRVGGKVPLNVYEGNRPVFQAHTPEEAARLVELLNRGSAAADAEIDPDALTGTADDAISRTTVDAIEAHLKQAAEPHYEIGHTVLTGITMERQTAEPARPEGLSIAEARSLLRQVAECISGVDQRQGLQELRMRIEAALQKR